MSGPRSGPEFGPAADFFSGIPPDVMETLMVLVEIELRRRDRLHERAVLVERENRSPAQNKITGTNRGPKATKILDARAMSRNHPVLK